MHRSIPVTLATLASLAALTAGCADIDPAEAEALALEEGMPPPTLNFRAIHSTTGRSGRLLRSALGDLNADGREDLVVLSAPAHEGTLQVHIYLAARSGQMEYRSTPLVFTGSAHRPHPLAIADVDGDGRLDIVVHQVDARQLEVLLGDGYGRVRARRTMPIDSLVIALAAGDVDGRGPAEIVIAMKNDGGDTVIAVVRVDAAGNMDGPWSFSPTGLMFVVDLALADIDGDAVVDLTLVGGNGGYRFFSMLGEGDGRFGAPRYHGVVSPRLRALRPDSTGRTGVLSIGEGTYVFRPEAPSSLTLAVELGGDFPEAVAGDFDGNGVGDVGVLSGWGSFELLRPTSDGSFVQHRIAEVVHTGRLESSDWNADGRSDFLVIGNTDASRITTYVSMR